MDQQMWGCKEGNFNPAEEMQKMIKMGSSFQSPQVMKMDSFFSIWMMSISD